MDQQSGRSWLSTIFETEALLAIGSLILFGWALHAVIYASIPNDNEQYVMLLLGALIGIVKDTFGRYFQSTKGAQELRRDFNDLAVADRRQAARRGASPQEVVVTNPATDPVQVQAADDFSIPDPPGGSRE